VVAQSKMCFDNLDTVIVGPNPAQDMAICPLLSVFCYPVEIKTLRRADPPSTES
jgi:hypothetical protein